VDISGLSDNGMLALVQMLNARKAQEQAHISALKLANEQIERNGENAILLIQTAPYGSLGNTTDIWA